MFALSGGVAKEARKASSHAITHELHMLKVLLSLLLEPGAFSRAPSPVHMFDKWGL